MSQQNSPTYEAFRKSLEAEFPTDEVATAENAAQDIAAPSHLAAHSDQHTPAETAPAADTQSALDVERPLLEQLGALQAELDEARAEIAVLRERSVQPRPVADDPFQEEMIELLRSEVTQLQSELAERDARYADVDVTNYDAAPDPEELPDRAEVERLCDRLDQLLLELECKDEQLAALQNELRAAEEANEAEQEERRQLEAWVDTIEQRVALRDQEWQETVARLEERLEHEQQQDRSIQEAVGQHDADVRVEALQRVISGLRQDQAGLQEQLEQARRENVALEQQVSDAQQTTSHEQSVVACQDRAEVARMEYEIEALRKQLSDRKALQGSDLRIRELRNHLRTVHEQEQEERRERSLSGRLSRLWKKLDGR